METAVVTPVKRKDKVNCSVTFLPDKKKATRANGIEDLEELNWKDYCNNREEFEVMLKQNEEEFAAGRATAMTSEEFKRKYCADL